MRHSMLPAVTALLLSTAVLPVGTGSAGLSPHAPIHINHDWDLLAQAAAEGWPGTGAAGDPIVISGYEIDMTGEDANTALVVGATDLHVVIRGNHLHTPPDAHSPTTYRGIWAGGTNLTVEDNLVEDFGWGIQARGSVVVQDNTVTSAHWEGISMEAYDGVVAHNTIRDTKIPSPALVVSPPSKLAATVDVHNNTIENRVLKVIRGVDRCPGGCTDAITIRDNTIRSDAWMTIESANGVLIEGNTFLDGSSLTIRSTTGTQVLSNHFLGDDNLVFILVNLDDATIANNLVEAGPEPIWLGNDVDVAWSIPPTAARGPNILGGPCWGGNAWKLYAPPDTNGDGIAELPYTFLDDPDDPPQTDAAPLTPVDVSSVAWDGSCEPAMELAP